MTNTRGGKETPFEAPGRSVVVGLHPLYRRAHPMASASGIMSVPTAMGKSRGGLPSWDLDIRFLFECLGVMRQTDAHEIAGKGLGQMLAIGRAETEARDS